MRLCWKGWMVVLLLAAPIAGLAATCTTQAEMTAQDRNSIAVAGQGITLAVLQQDYETLHGALLPAVAQDWEGMRAAVENAAPTLSLTSGNITINPLATPRPQGNPVSVTVTYSDPVLIPLFQPLLGTSFAMSSDAIMQVE